jgi:hypothetical protein
MTGDKEIDEFVVKLKSERKFYQKQLLARGDSLEATAKALAAIEESNAKLIQIVAEMCRGIRQEFRAVVQEVIAHRPAAPPPSSKPVTMKVTRGEDGAITGATIQ